MKALLLLAGRSRRFAPLEEKSLFPMCGKTLAEHQVETLKKGGCTDITLVVGAHNRKEMEALFPGFPLIEQEDIEAGMQGACLSALPSMQSGPVLIVSGNDMIAPEGIVAVLAEAAGNGVHGALLARKVQAYFPGGYLTVDQGRVTGIAEKPGEGNEPSALVNIVVHVHNDPAGLLAALQITKSDRDDGYEAALQSLFKTHLYRAAPYEGLWQPVKYPWHLLPLLETLLSRIQEPSIHPSVQVHPTAVIEGNVIIGEGTRILPHATVVGPCTIGRNCIIGNNALVRGSSVGDDCVIGYNSEVKGSVLAGPVWTHMTYLGDSIIGRNVSFGGGCTTGNLRLDEGEIFSADPMEESRRKEPAQLPTGRTKLGVMVGDGCRFGIQVGMNAGVKIGAGTFVTGGMLLMDDVDEKSFVTAKDGAVHIRPNKTEAPPMEKRSRYRTSL